MTGGALTVRPGIPQPLDGSWHLTANAGLTVGVNRPGRRYPDQHDRDRQQTRETISIAAGRTLATNALSASELVSANLG